MRRRLVILLILFATFLASCLSACAPAPSFSTADRDALPDPFSLEFQARGPNQRIIFYSLDEEGFLSFAGGTNAALRKTEPLGPTLESDRLMLWRIIIDHHLLDEKSQLKLLPGPTGYDLNVQAGRLTHRLSTEDQSHPGLELLDDALTDLHRRFSSDAAYRPIREAIDRSDGNVPKR
jgi:hypothetical protein